MSCVAVATFTHAAPALTARHALRQRFPVASAKVCAHASVAEQLHRRSRCMESLRSLATTDRRVRVHLSTQGLRRNATAVCRRTFTVCAKPEGASEAKLMPEPPPTCIFGPSFHLV